MICDLRLRFFFQILCIPIYGNFLRKVSELPSFCYYQYFKTCQNILSFHVKVLWFIMTTIIISNIPPTSPPPSVFSFLFPFFSLSISSLCTPLFPLLCHFRCLSRCISNSIFIFLSLTSCSCSLFCSFLFSLYVVLIIN